jgi:TBC1 domain family protein 5
MKHLESLDIVPQVFLIRWIRLLFGREFDFDAVLTLWDVIFAEDSSLELVDHVCIAMLLRIRWHLLDADYNTALGLLLRYPEQDKDSPAQSLGLDALYLQSHMTMEGGSYLVLKYTGRPLLRPDRPTTPPALQRNITTFSGINAIRSRSTLSATRTNRQSRNIEAVIQSTAKNFFLQGGKAVRSAVEEVQKKAQEIRESQTPPSSARKRSGTGLMMDRINDLEARNKKLSELLSGAVNELWDYQRLVNENEKAEIGPSHDQRLEKLSTAIAKVQFVQVYLDEPSLSLPEEESKSSESAVEASQAVEHAIGPDRNGQDAVEATLVQARSPGIVRLGSPISPTNATASLADPDSFDDFLEPPEMPEAQSSTTSLEETEPENRTEALGEPEVIPAKTSPARPPLEQSQFSFMLGQGSGTGTFAPVRSTASDASLFGGGRRDNRTSSTTAKDSLKQIAKSNSAGSDDFDFASLRKAKAGRK